MIYYKWYFKWDGLFKSFKNEQFRSYFKNIFINNIIYDNFNLYYSKDASNQYKILLYTGAELLIFKPKVWQHYKIKCKENILKRNQQIIISFSDKDRHKANFVEFRYLIWRYTSMRFSGIL